MVCGESPQPHATVSQAIFQNGEERKVIKGKSISKATRLPKFHSDFPGARQQERRGWLALDPPLAPAQSPSALPGDAEGLSAFSGAWGGVQLRGFAQGSSPPPHAPHTPCPQRPPRERSVPPSLPPSQRRDGSAQENSTCQEGNSGCLLRCGGSSFSPGASSPRPPSCLGCPSAGSWISPIRQASRRGPGAGRAHHGHRRARSATLRARSDTNFSTHGGAHHLFNSAPQ